MVLLIYAIERNKAGKGNRMQERAGHCNLNSGVRESGPEKGTFEQRPKGHERP